MGTIINKRILPEGKVLLQVEMASEEILPLEGNLKDIHLFSTDTTTYSAGVIETGVYHSTKYFIIPKELRAKIRQRKKMKLLGPVSCQKLETRKQHIFIYIVPKTEEPSFF